MKLRQKLLLLILLPVILLTSISSYYAYYTAKNLLQNQIYRTDQFKSADYSDQINIRLLKYESTVKNLAAMFSNKGISPADLTALVRAAAKADPEFLNVLVAFEDQRFIKSDDVILPSNFDVTTRDWYKQIISAGDQVKYSEPYTSVNTNNLMVTVGMPIKENGRAIGVVAMDIDLDKLLSIVGEMKTGQTGYVFVVNEHGDFLAHPQFKPTDQLQNIRNGEMAGFADKVNKEDYFTTTFNFGGKERLYSARDIGNTGWNLCTSMETDELFSQVGNMAFTLAISSIIILLLLGGIILYVIKDISSILKKMILVSEDLANGDFRDKPYKIIRKDEFGTMSDAMTNMRIKLRHVLEKISGSAELLAASSEELTASTDESAQASNQIAVSITSVAGGANEQLTALTTANTTIDTMSDLIGAMVKSSSDVAHLANLAATKAEAGNQSVAKAIEQMNSIEKTVGTSAQVVEELGKQSKEIGQIVDTIAGIAGQTNLLALNAAIEAARAGEQGKGFAVVAEEVRKLAEQSQIASGHIAELIQKIQTDTDKAVNAMKDGTKEVSIGNEVVKNTGVIFNEIEQMVIQVDEEITKAQKGIAILENSNQELIKTTQSVNAISQNASDEAQNVSAATQEQAASMEEMSSASQSLAKLAQTLQEVVSQFKIR